MACTVRGYGRASTDRQVLSTQQQEARLLDAFGFYTRSAKLPADAVWGGFFPDSGEDAISRTTKFRERNAGSMVLAATQAGDVIIVTNYDRIFASVIDVCETLELCRDRRFRLIVMDCDIDTGTILGEGLFKIMAIIKEMEVKEIRRRSKEAAGHRMKVGLPQGRACIGWKSVAVMEKGRIRKYFQPDHKERRFANKLLAEHQKWKKNYNQGSQFANSLRMFQMDGERWTRPTYTNWIRAAEQGFPLPNGELEAAPIPSDAQPVALETIGACD